MEVIQISQKTAQSLGALNSVPKATLGSICRYFLQMVVAGNSSIAIDESLDEVLCAISTTLLEAAKVQANPEQLRSTLNENQVSADVATALVDLYTQHRDTLIQHMLETGISLPQIVDIEWRLDYSVRSKQGGRENKPLYFVSLKVKDRGIVRSIDMIASQEELLDLFNKVRDAVKQVERVLNTTDSSSAAATA